VIIFINMRPYILLLASFLIALIAEAQIKLPEGKKSLIVLTYDDALASHLDIAIPQLDKAGLKGTFFMKEPANEQHIQRWRDAARKGHELGNHTVYHPCQSSKFAADPHYHAETYSVANIIHEISTMNKILTAIDGKMAHTFAYPCGETEVGGKSYIDTLRKSGFVKYARGVGINAILTDFKKIDPYNVPCMGFSTNGPSSEILNFVKQVQEKKAMSVLIFHGVGGDYLEVSKEAHQELVNYLKNNKDIWVTTFEEAMIYISKNQ
jgi:peptidoglycan-N-acetylglucosamine deacetylase